MLHVKCPRGDVRSPVGLAEEAAAVFGSISVDAFDVAAALIKKTNRLKIYTRFEMSLYIKK